jgi:hypothetical protein
MSEIEREKHASYVKDRQAWLASTFRDLMTTGQSSKILNTYRKKFYDEVIGLVNEVNCPTPNLPRFSENDKFFERRKAAIWLGRGIRRNALSFCRPIPLIGFG